ncbi:MAG: hypothetical protein Q9M92_18175, partial [Enterobacterales bacterium]|nr:hypothetical protein [Enterobacterales bacterium]
MSFLHYVKKGDVTVPIIGIAMLCAGFTDAFHTLAATRIIAANAANTDFIPFTWAFSRIYNATVMIAGLGISLWFIRNRKARKTWNLIQEYKLLVLVALLFVGIAIVSVLTAATSQNLPTTTFPSALITRPYDVLPLALFLFTGALAWSWYKLGPSVLKLAIMYSIVPEVVTQLHMSFGSVALFDNDFNIAHALKIFAYACILIGLLISISSTKTASKINTALNFEDQPTKYQSSLSKLNLLDIGKAKYSQALVIPLTIFLLMLIVTSTISTLYYKQTKIFLIQEQHNQLVLKTKQVENVLLRLYEQVDRDIHFLSQTHPIQGIIQSVNSHSDSQTSLAFWKKRIEDVFRGILKTNLDYTQIRYLSFDQKIAQLVAIYRIGNRIHALPLAGQEDIDLDDFLAQTKSMVPGQTVFSDLLLNQTINKQQMTLLKIAIPIFDKQKDRLFGVIEMSIDINSYLIRLRSDLLEDLDFHLANNTGVIVFNHSTENRRFLNRKMDERFNIGSSVVALSPVDLDLMENNNQSYTTIKLDFSDSNYQQSNYDNVLYYRFLLWPFSREKALRVIALIDRQAIDMKLDNLRLTSILLGLAFSIFGLTLGIIA